MKAKKFARQLMDAAGLHAGIGQTEPVIAVRHERDGPEYAVRHVKVRRDKDVPIIILEVGAQYPTEDAFMAACRATNWRNAQLRAHGIEPIQIPMDAAQYPPEGFDFRGVEADEAFARSRKAA